MAENSDRTDEQKAGAKRPMAQCTNCGRPYAPLRQVERLRKKLGDRAILMDLCPGCRRREQGRAAQAARRSAVTTKQEVPDVS